MQFEKNIHSWVFQRLQIALVLRTRAILIVTRSCFFQIAFETILLPIQTLPFQIIYQTDPNHIIPYIMHIVPPYNTTQYHIAPQNIMQCNKIVKYIRMFVVLTYNNLITFIFREPWRKWNWNWPRLRLLEYISCIWTP